MPARPRIASLLALGFSLVLLAGEAHAFGEVFKLDTSGTRYCGDFDVQRFSPRTDVDFWIRIDDATSLSLSTSPAFLPADTIVLTGANYLTSRTGATFSAAAALGNGGYVAIHGTARFDRFGNITKVSGTFVEFNLFDDSCFTTGKARTVGRPL